VLQAHAPSFILVFSFFFKTICATAVILLPCFGALQIYFFSLH
jgi:hypothetical protein